MIVTGPDHAGHFMNLLGSGSKLGCRLTYRVQDEAGGIPHALALAEEFVGNDHVTVILGDNLFEDNFAAPISSFQGGAMTFYKAVPDAHRFGVVEIDAYGNVLSIEEKPRQPKTNFAQVGLYLYDSSVFDVIRTLKPSGRGEFEIVDVNNAYLQKRQLTAKPVRGFWTDAGTFESLQRATEYFSKLI
jgi:glucose-1-phosphate thymidylyltransferase